MQSLPGMSALFQFRIVHSVLSQAVKFPVVLLVAFLSIGVECYGNPDEARATHIVLIVADDLGYGDLSCYGCTDSKTPVLDGLAREGVRFTNFYANGPECTPTRTALMTGRYQQRAGGLECALGTGNVGRYDDAMRLAAQHELGLPPSQNVLVGSLKRAGYHAAGFGKWHLGYERKFWPLCHGFDHYFGPLGGGVDYFYHTEWHGWHVLHENGRRVKRDGYMTDLITDGAVDYVSNYRHDKPLFLYVPYTCPHTPIQGPKDKRPVPLTKENWNEGTRDVYAAMVEHMDAGIGEILTAVDRRGWTDHTLVIFFSDNGGTKLADNGPLRGHKGGCFEGGIREPCIVRWPGVLSAGKTTDQTAISLDLTRSILAAAGAKPPKNLPPDGVDVLKLLADGGEPVHRTLFWRQRRGDLTWRAVRDGPLKYLSRTVGDDREEYLFDLAADVGEQHDLSAERAEDLSRMKKLLADWEAHVRPAR